MKFLGKEKGFTLIELLVVVSIIGVLASIVLNSLNKVKSQARDARRDIDVRLIKQAMEIYHINNGSYPIMNTASGWAHSNDDNSWNFLESYIGNLPLEPINSSGFAYNGAYTYSLFSYPQSWACPGQAYILVYNKENSNGISPTDGVRLCNNTLYNFNNAFAVGKSPRDN